MKTFAFFLFLSTLTLSMPQPDSLNIDSLNKFKADNTRVDTSGLVTISNIETNGQIIADLRDFPSLHPLVVHFAIVLILVAAMMQIVNIFLLRKEIGWIIAFFLLAGLIAAIFAGGRLHPHTEGLSSHAQMVLEEHDKWAEWTIITASVAFALHIIYLFLVRKSKRLIRNLGQRIKFTFRFYRGLAIIIALILIVSSFCVLRAGHYGAQLVHIEGVGPQGKYLEEHDH